MSHIVAFKVDGLAGRTEPVEIKLNRDTNIFFGENGSGKTSLLKILAAAMANETHTLMDVPFTGAEVKIFSVNMDKVFTRSIKKVATRHHTKPRVRMDSWAEPDEEPSEPGAEPQRMEWVTSPSFPKEAASTRWKYKYLPTSRLHTSDAPFDWYAESVARRTFSFTEAQLDSIFAISVKQLWVQYSTRVLSGVRKAQEEGLASILRAVLSPEGARGRQADSKLTPEAAYALVQSFLRRQSSASILGSKTAFKRRYDSDPTLRDVVQDIDSVEGRIEIAMSSRNRLQELIANMFRKNKSIVFKDDAIHVVTPTGERIGLESLSSGEKHILRIFVEALLIDESALLIDEPEISMHVDWQKQLVESIRALNNKAQLIFATHSPEIMADVPDEKIIQI